jgi:hypothetical protein
MTSPDPDSDVRARIQSVWGTHALWPGWATLDSLPTARAQLELLFSRLGREECPALLFDWWYGGLLSVDDLRAVLPVAWSDPEFPQRCLAVEDWVGVFRTAGFVSDAGQSASTEMVRVFRGATWGQRRGMAWTRNVTRARWFADRLVRRGKPAYVFECVVEPTAVLAMLDSPDGRREDEVVVEPRLLPPLTGASIVGVHP